MPVDGERFRTVLENRSEVLRRLVGGAAAKPELVRELHASRSTVDRAVRDLREIGCVEADGGTFVPTPAGRLALREYDRYRDATDGIRETREFLGYLDDCGRIDPALLEGATVNHAEEHAPERALEPGLELLSDARRLLGLAPVLLSFYSETIADRIDDGAFSVEIVATEAVVGALAAVDDDPTADVADGEAFALFEADRDLPYALWVIETPDGDWAGVTAHEGGGVAGILLNDDEAAVDWARSEYERYREAARPVPPSEL